MIRVRFKKNQPLNVRKRIKNKAIIRKKISGTKERPRLVVFRSHRHIYAQLVDDSLQKTVAGVSTLKIKEGKKTPCEQATVLGENLAEIAKKKGIKKVVFDRNGYIYHGRIKAIADGARKAGLVF